MISVKVDWGDVSEIHTFNNLAAAIRYGHRVWVYGATVTVDDVALEKYLDVNQKIQRKYINPHRSAYLNAQSDLWDWCYDLTMYR